MTERLPIDDVKKHSELCPGGDIRIKRNRWLYDSLEEAGKGRLLREGRLRMLVGCLVFSEQLCQILRACLLSLLEGSCGMCYMYVYVHVM